MNNAEYTMTEFESASANYKKCEFSDEDQKIIQNVMSFGVMDEATTELPDGNTQEQNINEDKNNQQNGNIPPNGESNETDGDESDQLLRMAF